MAMVTIIVEMLFAFSETSAPFGLIKKRIITQRELLAFCI